MAHAATRKPKETHVLDASREPLGRIAARAAFLLLGKHRATFQKHVKPPVQVVMTHSDELLLTGRKEKQKRYYRHSGYLGHLKEFTAEEMKARDSRKVVRLAILGMLPKNRMRKELIKRVTIYKGSAPAA